MPDIVCINNSFSHPLIFIGSNHISFFNEINLIIKEMELKEQKQNTARGLRDTRRHAHLSGF